jgi:hypothetical protein
MSEGGRALGSGQPAPLRNFNPLTSCHLDDPKGGEISGATQCSWKEDLLHSSLIIIIRPYRHLTSGSESRKPAGYISNPASPSFITATFERW